MILKFIFPQNYNLKTKLFGFIDYSIAILDVILGVIILLLLKILKTNLSFKVFIFVIMYFPIIIFSIVGFNGENIINVCKYLIKYMVKPKVLLFKK